jgi:hypothetical protein
MPCVCGFTLNCFRLASLFLRLSLLIYVVFVGLIPKHRDLLFYCAAQSTAQNMFL